MKYAGKNPKAKDAEKNRKTNGNPSSEAKKSRKSASGLSGSSKKGGHSEKFTWIGPVALDANDPNFDDSEDVAAV
ncbi:uncharacterized protein DS421_5g170810 [Arachis hypogaea]|nr:uncharacterized protein DS421_5g170810 [Arachis hypogaea]